MSVGHYENFPVGSLALPRRLRKPVHAIYAFARTADDLADEGEAGEEERLQVLDGLRNGEMTSSAERLFPWVRPLALYWGNRWSRQVSL